MSLSDTINADVTGLFFAGNGDFDVALAYIEQGVASRTIQGIWEDSEDPIFETGTADLDFDVKRIWIPCADNVAGVLAPTVSGRGGNSGDQFTAAGDSRTWYVRKILQNGKGTVSKAHLLLVATSKAAFPLL